MKLVSFNPTEVARQLALVEKDIFDKISPGEYSHQGWTRDNKLDFSPNIVAMIERFNTICNWTASEVLREPNLKERAVILHRLIIIAEVRFFTKFSSLLFYSFFFYELGIKSFI